MASHTPTASELIDSRIRATVDLPKAIQQRDELLAALEAIMRHVGDHDCLVCEAARAAIRAARGE